MFLRLSDLFRGVEVNGRSMNIHWLFQEYFALLTLPFFVQNKTQTGKLLRVKIKLVFIEGTTPFKDN